jgi:hypothetical protein
MAATSAVFKEGLISANSRYKVYKVTHDGSDTSIAIIPGEGFGHPVGSYDCYTSSSGTYTITLTAGTSTYVSVIIFFSL